MNVKITKLRLIGLNDSFAYAAGLRCNDGTTCPVCIKMLNLLGNIPCFL